MHLIAYNVVDHMRYEYRIGYVDYDIFSLQKNLLMMCEYNFKYFLNGPIKTHRVIIACVLFAIAKMSANSLRDSVFLRICKCILCNVLYRRIYCDQFFAYLPNMPQFCLIGMQLQKNTTFFVSILHFLNRFNRILH